MQVDYNLIIMLHQLFFAVTMHYQGLWHTHSRSFPPFPIHAALNKKKTIKSHVESLYSARILYCTLIDCAIPGLGAVWYTCQFSRGLWINALESHAFDRQRASKSPVCVCVNKPVWYELWKKKRNKFQLTCTLSGLHRTERGANLFAVDIYPK